MTPAQRRACRAHRSRLDAVLDGWTAQRDAQAFEAHVRRCPACAAELIRSRAVRALLDAVPFETDGMAGDDVFVASVFARIDAEASVAPATRARSRSRRVAVALFAAAALVLAATRVRLGVAERPGLQLGENPVAIVQAPGPLDAPVVEEVSGHGTARFEEMPIEIDRRPIDTARFRLALDQSAIRAAFQPEGAASATHFVEELRRLFDGNVLQGARELVADASAPPRTRALATRALGSLADHRDRSQLGTRLADPEVGLAAAFALTDAGRGGAQVLWNAVRHEAAGAAAAEAALVAVASLGDGRDPTRWLEVSQCPRAGARLVAAGAGASGLLERYLADRGDGRAWLEAWIQQPEATESLSAALDRSPRRGRGSARTEVRWLRAIAARGNEGHVEFALAALERGSIAAAETLAQLPGTAGVRALFGATQFGALLPALEETAWAKMSELRPEQTLEVLLERPEQLDSRASALVGALVRAGSATEDDAAAATSLGARAGLLIELALHGEIDVATRARALLFVASCDADGVRPAVCGRLTPLRRDDSPALAAAAWLATWHLQSSDVAPPSVVAAYGREGSLLVRHARVERALARARSLAAGRGGRGSL